jgi:hypothetical protein
MRSHVCGPRAAVDCAGEAAAAAAYDAILVWRKGQRLRRK